MRKMAGAAMVILILSGGGSSALAQDGPRRWRPPRFTVLIGPVVRSQRLTGDGSVPRMTRDWGVSASVGRSGRVGRRGLGPKLSVSILPRRTGIMESLSPGARALGTARFRLIMAGLKWTQPLAPRWALQAYGVAGYSFNRFVTSDNGQAPRGAPQSVLPSPIATIRNSAAAETGL